MTRLRGRCERGKRLYASSPHGHWRTTTMISSVRVDGSTACMSIEGATDGQVFSAYVQQILCPSLKRGDIVVMDNLGAHKNAKAMRLLEEAGAQVEFLPAYSPELNPIELMWSKVKGVLRREEPRSHDDLLAAIGTALNSITAQDARNWFSHCGYSFI
jgi:transposase